MIINNILFHSIFNVDIKYFIEVPLPVMVYYNIGKSHWCRTNGLRLLFSNLSEKKSINSVAFEIQTEFVQCRVFQLPIMIMYTHSMLLTVPLNSLNELHHCVNINISKWCTRFACTLKSVDERKW